MREIPKTIVGTLVIILMFESPRRTRGWDVVGRDQRDLSLEVKRKDSTLFENPIGTVGTGRVEGRIGTEGTKTGAGSSSEMDMNSSKEGREREGGWGDKNVSEIEEGPVLGERESPTAGA